MPGVLCGRGALERFGDEVDPGPPELLISGGVRALFGRQRELNDRICPQPSRRSSGGSCGTTTQPALARHPRQFCRDINWLQGS